MRGKGTRLVWNSFKSTLSEPSKRRDAVTDETTCAMSLLRLGKLGCATPSFCLQMSKMASLSTYKTVRSQYSACLATSMRTMNEQSECSRVVCVVRTELYGSTIELDS